MYLSYIPSDLGGGVTLIPPSPQPEQPALRGFTTVAPSGNHSQTGPLLIPPPTMPPPMLRIFSQVAGGGSCIPPTHFAGLNPPTRIREGIASRGAFVGETISDPSGKQGGGGSREPTPHGCGNEPSPLSCHPPCSGFFCKGVGGVNL